MSLQLRRLDLFTCTSDIIKQTKLMCDSCIKALTQVCSPLNVVPAESIFFLRKFALRLGRLKLGNCV